MHCVECVCVYLSRQMPYTTRPVTIFYAHDCMLKDLVVKYGKPTLLTALFYNGFRLLTPLNWLTVIDNCFSLNVVSVGDAQYAQNLRVLVG